MKNKTKFLGLLKINMCQTHPQSPQMLGSIRLQKHLLKPLFLSFPNATKNTKTTQLLIPRASSEE